MIEKVKISNIQVALLTFLIITGGDILYIPTYLSHIARQDSWIGNILGVCFGLLFIFIYTAFARRFPNKSFAEICELILGRIVGKLVAFLFYFYFLVLISLMVKEFGEFMKIQMLTETPIVVIHILFLTVIVIGARLGLETFARTAEITFPFIILLFFVLVTFSLSNVKLDNFFPMFEYGAIPLFESAFHYQFFTNLQLVGFLFIFPSIQGGGLIKKPFFIGSLIGGLILIILTTLSIGVLGADSILLQFYPSYVLAKSIYIGEFLTRIEVMIALIWFLTIYFKTTFYFYVLSFGLSQTLKLNDYRILTLPLGIIAIVYSTIIYPNPVYYNEALQYWNSFILTTGFVLPLVMLGIAKLRKIQSK